MKRQKSLEKTGAALYLVATPIGNLEEMTPRAIAVLKQVDVIAAEDTRNTRKLLTHFDIHTKLIAHHKYNEAASTHGLLELLDAGKSIALVSDAGYPLISDPGERITKAVIDAGYPVIPISGANAMLNALVASGLVTQPFLFYGFLPSHTKEQIKELQLLREYPQTLIFYEAPHRMEKTLDNMLTVFGDRECCLARELTKRHEEFLRGQISEIRDACETLRGEMVLVVSGYQKEKDQALDMPAIYARIDRYINEGCSSKEAIKKAATECGISKNELYKQYHEQLNS